MRTTRGLGLRRLRGMLAAAAASGTLLSPVLAADPINVATYNLRVNKASDGPNAWPHRKEMVKALIRHHEFDIVATQEGLIDQLRELDAMPGWARVGVGRDDGRQGGEHSAIYFRSARFELRRHGDFWLSATPDKPSISWDSRCCNRLATWAELRDGTTGRDFLVFSVHFDHEGEVSRRESARLMLSQVRELAGGKPVICMGDFNATPQSEPIRTLLGGLRDAHALSETPPYGPVGSFNDFRFDTPADRRIDYVFLTTGIRVLKYAVLTDSQHARYPSDHFPVLVRLQLP
jgi:endonuclease/exonuclease/phosphatase family metal-dependent hydrolase